MVDLLRAIRARFDERRQRDAQLDTSAATWVWRTALEVAEHQAGKRKSPPDLGKLDEMLAKLGLDERQFADACDTWTGILNGRQLEVDYEEAQRRSKAAAIKFGELIEEQDRLRRDMEQKRKVAESERGAAEWHRTQLGERIRTGEADRAKDRLNWIASFAPEVVRAFRLKEAKTDGSPQ